MADIILKWMAECTFLFFLAKCPGGAMLGHYDPFLFILDISSLVLLLTNLIYSLIQAPTGYYLIVEGISSVMISPDFFLIYNFNISSIG